MIRVVLFDFDGTLVDSNAVKSACLEAVVAGVPGGAEALAKARALGGNRHKLFVEVARLLEAPGTRVDARALIAAYTACCRRGIASAPERAGTTRVLAALRARGIRLWLNSATPHRELLAIVRDRGLLPCFDGVLGGPAAKTSNIRRVLAAERIHPRQALMVGDGQDDLEAARNLGTWFVAVTAEGLPGRGPFAMRDLRRLLALVDRLRARPLSRVPRMKHSGMQGRRSRIARRFRGSRGHPVAHVGDGKPPYPGYAPASLTEARKSP